MRDWGALTLCKLAGRQVWPVGTFCMSGSNQPAGWEDPEGDEDASKRNKLRLLMGLGVPLRWLKVCVLSVPLRWLKVCVPAQ